MPIEVWDQVLGIDLRGTFLCLRAELKVMVETGHGSIVNMASNAGLKNAPGMAAYTTAKHGVIGLTKNTALQYARRNIRVNAVCPGTILTPGLAGFPEETQREWANLVPSGRLGTPEEVAQSVAYLLSAGAGVDVVGLRCWQLPHATLTDIVREHPRDHFKEYFSQAWSVESARVPRGRARLLRRYGAFDVAIRLAPFDT